MSKRHEYRHCPDINKQITVNEDSSHLDSKPEYVGDGYYKHEIEISIPSITSDHYQAMPHYLDPEVIAYVIRTGDDDTLIVPHVNDSYYQEFLAHLGDDEIEIIPHDLQSYDYNLVNEISLFQTSALDIKISDNLTYSLEVPLFINMDICGELDSYDQFYSAASALGFTQSLDFSTGSEYMVRTHATCCVPVFYDIQPLLEKMSFSVFSKDSHLDKVHMEIDVYGYYSLELHDEEKAPDSPYHVYEYYMSDSLPEHLPPLSIAEQITYDIDINLV